jgi:hypothetical protein
MHLLRLRTLVVVVAVPVGATLLAGVPLAVPNASAAPVPLVKCSSMRSEANSSSAPIALGGCDRPKVTGGSGTWSGTLTWSTGKQTNFVITSNTGPSLPGRCPYGFELDTSGVIASVSGPWTKRFLGDTVTFDACLAPMGPDPGYVVTEGLVPGTFFTITRPS